MSTILDPDTDPSRTTELDRLDHVAIPVTDIAVAVAWYEERFHCQVRYQDDTWAMLEFANVRLALVVPEQHPGHIAITREDAAEFGPLKRHRDGTESTYIADPFGNSVEVLEA